MIMGHVNFVVYINKYLHADQYFMLLLSSGGFSNFFLQKIHSETLCLDPDLKQPSVCPDPGPNNWQRS